MKDRIIDDEYLKNFFRQLEDIDEEDMESMVNFFTQKTYFFCEISLFLILSQFWCLQRVLGPHFGRFGGTWDTILVILEGPGEVLKFQWILGYPLGHPKSWDPAQGRVTASSPAHTPTSRLAIQDTGYNIEHTGYRSRRNRGYRIDNILRSLVAPDKQGPADIYILFFYKLFVCRGRRFAGIHFQNLFLKKCTLYKTIRVSKSDAGDGGGDGGSFPTTLPAWPRPRGYHAQESNIPFGESLTLIYIYIYIYC